MERPRLRLWRLPIPLQASRFQELTRTSNSAITWNEVQPSLTESSTHKWIDLSQSDDDVAMVKATKQRGKMRNDENHSVGRNEHCCYGDRLRGLSVRSVWFCPGHFLFNGPIEFPEIEIKNPHHLFWFIHRTRSIRSVTSATWNCQIYFSNTR